MSDPATTENNWHTLDRERARFRLLVDELAAGCPADQKLYLRAAASRLEAALQSMAEQILGPRAK